MPGVPVMAASDEYTTHPTKTRLFFDDTETDGCPWNVDAVDDEGRYTEACARFATELEALDHVAAFAREVGIPEVVPTSLIAPWVPGTAPWITGDQDTGSPESRP